MERQENYIEADQFVTLGSTPDEQPHTPREDKPHNNDNNGVGSTLATPDVTGQVMKRGRGRPRKYDVVGNTVSSTATARPPGFSDQTHKRGRGRPRGSGKLQILASMGGFVAETAGGNIIPHVLTVRLGEDLVSTIMSFFDKGTRAVCILSATGAVSDVAIRQNGASHAIMRLEGTFEILSLSGACTYASSPTGPVRKSGTLSVSLARSDGRVYGGVLESALVAACPIQLVMASFKQNISSQVKRKQLSAESPDPLLMASNSDSEREQAKHPKLTEGEKSCSPPPPTAATTNNGVTENVLFPATSNGVAEDSVVIPPDHRVNSASVDAVVDFDSQAPQPASDDSDQRTSADANASVTEL